MTMPEEFTVPRAATHLHRLRTPLVEVDFDESPSHEDLMPDKCGGLCVI